MRTWNQSLKSRFDVWRVRRPPYRALFDQMASVVHKPESAAKLLAVLREQAKLGLLESFIDMKAAELGVHPTYQVRSIERPAPRRKK